MEPYFAIAVLIILPIVMFFQFLQMRIEYAHFIKDRSVEKTEAELMLGDAINNYKTVQSFGHEEAIVDIYKGLLAPSEEAGHANNLCNSIIYGTSFFILTA